MGPLRCTMIVALQYICVSIYTEYTGIYVYIFLTTFELVELFRAQHPPIPSIPSGSKENVAFVIDNSANRARKSANKKCEYYDDCGLFNKNINIDVISGH